MNTQQLTTHNLTDLQAAFVVAYTSAEGCRGKVKEAALAAGYSPKTAREIGRQALALPHVQAAIFEANKAQIGGPLLTLAVGVLRDILEDEKAPLKLRADAAKTILDRGGLPAVRAPDEPARRAKELEELSIYELETVIRDAKEARDLAALPMIEGEFVQVS